MEQTSAGGRALTVGSLFDGSGGFPLGAERLGMHPLWASEIEPFPIAVTRRRFPNMEHLGDVSLIKGAEIPPVDIITFGSPCQGLSLAGRREGLADVRSNLFYQALRVVREMREATDGEHPRFIVWENVFGALSSNCGQDFRAVLQEVTDAKYEGVHVPQPQRWFTSGLILENGYSLAWRVLDAQYWGVPQKRRRVFLVADFAGGCAEQLLFEPESVQRYLATLRRAWKGTSEGVEGGSGGELLMFENHSQDSRYRGPLDMAQTLTSRMGTGGNNQPLVVESYHLNKAYGLDRAAFNQGRNAQYTPQCVEECEPTLVSRGPNAVAHYSVGHGSFMTEAYHEQVGTLQATDYKDPPVVNDESGGRYIVRRLTPTECGRLQGFPDGWCDGLENENPTEEEVREWLDIFRTHDRVVGYETNRTEGQIRRWLQNPRTDAAEYKMWGNGVALPCVVAVMESIQRGLKLEEGREPCESEQQNLF